MSNEEFLGKDARLKKAPSQLLASTAFAEELDRASRLYGLFDFADCAHLLALQKAGVLARETAHSLCQRILELRRNGVKPQRFDPGIGDVYNNRDAFLSQEIGPDYGHVHFGRSRREATNIAWLLDLRRLLADGIEGLAGLVETLAAVARNSKDLVLPDYTYLQRAHPTTLGHYLLATAFPLLRDSERLEQALALVDSCPAGIGSVNGTSYNIDREFLRDTLGFSKLLTNTRDAMWPADLPGTLLGALSVSAVTLDRFCEDLQIWATSEFDFIELDDSHCRTSVIMPQKKNPYALTGLRGFARTTVGNLVNGLTTNMTPTGQPDNRIFSYGALPSACEDYGRWVRLLDEVVAKMAVKECGSACFNPSDFVFATEVIDFLALNADMTNRQAHELVGSVINGVLAGGHPEEEVVAQFLVGLRKAGVPDYVASRISALTEPSAIIEGRTGTGSANPKEVVRMANEAADAAAQIKNRIHSLAIGWSEAALEQSIEAQLKDVAYA